MKGKEDDIANSYSAKRRQLDSLRNGGSRTDLAALLAARDDLAVTEKTSSASVRKNTNAKILKHVIGQVLYHFLIIKLKIVVKITLLFLYCRCQTGEVDHMKVLHRHQKCHHGKQTAAVAQVAVEVVVV